LFLLEAKDGLSIRNYAWLLVFGKSAFDEFLVILEVVLSPLLNREEGKGFDIVYSGQMLGFFYYITFGETLLSRPSDMWIESSSLIWMSSFA